MLVHNYFYADCLGYCCEATTLRSRLILVAYMTSLGSLHQKPSSFEIILDVCKSLHLPRFQVIEIEALSNLLPSKWYRCGRENSVSCRKPHFRGGRANSHDWSRFFSQNIWRNSWNFEALWNPLECGNTLETRFEMLGEKYSAILPSLSTCWRMCDSTIYCNFFFVSEMLFYRMVRYWFIYSCGKIKR